MALLVPHPREGDQLPASYQPDKGLMKVEAAAAAEKRFRRVKDKDGLFLAVETKLREQRDFVLWLDGLLSGKAGRGRPPRNSDGSVRIPELLARHGLDEKTVSRWRTRLVVKDEPGNTTRYDTALKVAQDRCLKVCESGPDGSGRNPSVTGEQDWQTPAEHLDAARRVMNGIRLDPMSSDKAQERVGAEEHRTQQDDGLAIPWCDGVFLNPGYSRPVIEAAVSKLCEEMDAGRCGEAIMLTNNATDTVWCQTAMARADRLCFVKGRIIFLTPAGETADRPMQGQMFFYFGPNVERFEREFRPFGVVVRPLTGDEEEDGR